MTTISTKPNDWRRVLRHHILRATSGRIDNRTLIRDNAQLAELLPTRSGRRAAPR